MLACHWSAVRQRARGAQAGVTCRFGSTCPAHVASDINVCLLIAVRVGKSYPPFCPFCILASVQIQARVARRLGLCSAQSPQTFHRDGDMSAASRRKFTSIRVTANSFSSS